MSHIHLTKLPSIRCKYFFLSVFLFISIKFSFSQSDIFNTDWNKVTITSPIYPEFNLVQYKNLIIAEVLDERGRQNNNTQIIYNKIAGKLHEISNVNLLDREKTNLILKEYKLQSTGHVEEDYITPFGKFFSSGIIMTGRIVNLDYKSEITTSNSIITSNGRKKKRRKGTYNLSFSFQFIDIATTKIVFSKTIDVKHTVKTKSDYTTPPTINKNEVYIGAIGILADKFQKLFITHEIDYAVEFQKNAKFNSDLKNIAALVQVEEFDLAYKELNNILKNKKVKKNDRALSSAYYNIALLALYINKIDDAKKYSKLGYLKNPNNDACLKLSKVLQ